MEKNPDLLPNSPPPPGYPSAGPYGVGGQPVINQPQQQSYNIYGQNPPSYFPESSYVQQPAQLTVVQVIPLGGNSTHMVCPHCNANISTRVKYVPGTCTHIAACVMCCFVCWPLVWLPYCIDDCQDAEHECPNCGSNLGYYKR